MNRLILEDMGFLTWHIRVLTVLSISAGAADCKSYCSNDSVSCRSQVNTLTEDRYITFRCVSRWALLRDSITGKAIRCVTGVRNNSAILRQDCFMYVCMYVYI